MTATTAQQYLPGPDGSWERGRPEQLGLDPERLAGSVAYAEAHETHLDRDLHRLWTS